MKNYYAEYCPYGRNTMSEGDRLQVFSSREERDKWVAQLGEKGNDLTYKLARCWYGLPLTPGKYRRSIL